MDILAIVQRRDGPGRSSGDGKTRGILDVFGRRSWLICLGIGERQGERWVSRAQLPAGVLRKPSSLSYGGHLPCGGKAEANTLTFLPELSGGQRRSRPSSRNISSCRPASASLQSVTTPFLHREENMPRFPLIHLESMLLKNLTHIWLKSQSMHFMF